MLFPPLEARVFSTLTCMRSSEGRRLPCLHKRRLRVRVTAVALSDGFYSAVVRRVFPDLIMRSSFSVPRRDLDCARRVLPCAEVHLRRDFLSTGFTFSTASPWHLTVLDQAQRRLRACELTKRAKIFGETVGQLDLQPKKCISARDTRPPQGETRKAAGASGSSA